MTKQRTTEHFDDPGQFHSWLSANHGSSNGIWLKIAKKNERVQTSFPLVGGG